MPTCYGPGFLSEGCIIKSHKCCVATMTMLSGLNKKGAFLTFFFFKVQPLTAGFSIIEKMSALLKNETIISSKMMKNVSSFNESKDSNLNIL